MTVVALLLIFVALCTIASGIQPLAKAIEAATGQAAPGKGETKH